MEPRVLVVEDDPELRPLLVRLIRGASGSQADTAQDGEEALGKVDSTRPDLVFLDMMLPGVSGFQVVKALKRSHPHIRVIGMSTRENRGAAHASGCDDFLVKPFDVYDVEWKLTYWGNIYRFGASTGGSYFRI